MSFDTDDGSTTGTNSDRDDALVGSDSSERELVGGALVATSTVALLGGFLGLLRFVPVSNTLAGIRVGTLLGAVLTVAGAGTMAVGLSSIVGAPAERPRHPGGLVDATVFGLAWFVTGGLVAAYLLGLGSLWPIVALVAGVGATVAALVAREDVGVTLPGGALVALTGGVVATGVIGPGWTWSPSAFSATVTPTTAVPVLLVVGGLLAGWITARIYGGFGAKGRQTGAYVLVGANAAGMLAFLGLLVSFIVVRGFGPMTEGIKFGLFWGPVTWFHLPVLNEWLIIEGPIVWFYWPFVMEGYGLTTPMNGIFPAIVGTVWLVAGAIVIAVPLGVGCAVFLTEYAEQGRFTFLVETATNGLWSTPSIVYGLFGLAFFVPRLGNTNTILSGQIVLGFMLLPLVVITSRESLKSVPDEYRDASAALGVSKWETIKSVVLPAAMPGVITGVILGVGRIAGETAPILLVMVSDPFPTEAPTFVEGWFRFTGSAPFVAGPELNLVQSSSALPYQLYAVITAGLSENIDFAWATALVLLLVVMSFYAIGIASRIYFRRKLTA
jgi:phosphate transport system permease protein